MQFAQPIWLLIGALACAVLVWGNRRFDVQQRAALARFAAARLVDQLTSSVSPARRRLKRGLFVMGMALLFATLARPQAGFTWQETHRQGLEVLFAVDTSKSMLAQDVKPDRLSRAKLAISDLAGKLNGDGVGLIAFAGDAFLQCPVTLDYDAFRESLQALDVNVIPRGGTDIASAIQEAQAVFKTRSAAERILVLLTDGEDLGGEAVAAAHAAAKEGVKIFTVGVGSATGELVPVPSEHGGTDFARDAQGQLVKSHLDEATLRQIAEATGAIYQPLGAHGQGLEDIYEKGLAPFARHDLSSRQSKVPIERFMWALAAAVLCFAGEMLIGNRRRVRARSVEPAPVKKSRPPRVLRPAAAAIALLVGSVGAHAGIAQTAEQDFQKGDFAKAQQEYAAGLAKDPSNAALQFNTGSAAYKAGDYAQAAEAFRKSLATGPVPVQQSAYYNLGNTQYRLGQKSEKEKPQEAIEKWEEAVKSYDAALQITPGAAAAKHNRDLVQSRIDQLKQQEEQKKQEQEKKEQDKSKDGQSQPQNQAGGEKKQDGKKDGQQSQPQSQGGQEQDHADRKGQPPTETGGPQSQPSQGRAEQKDEQGQADPKTQSSPKPEEKNEHPEQAPAAPKEQGGEKSNDTAKPDQAAQAGARKSQAQPAPAAEKRPSKAVNAGEKPQAGQAQASAGEPTKDAPAPAPEELREPGQMTREEAKGLLDAMKGEERPAPAISQRGRAGLPPSEHKTLHDW